MTIATNGYTLSTSAYTLVASAYGRARLVTDNNKLPVKIIAAGSLPSADSDDWFPLQPGQILTIEGMEAFNVYAMGSSAAGGDAVTQKLRVLTDGPASEIVVKPLF
jgi:hypothetical protein